jgi:hypothetical protein
MLYKKKSFILLRALIIFAFTGIILGLPFPSYADQNPFVKELMEKSGIIEQTNLIPQVIISSFAGQINRSDSSLIHFKNEINDIILNSYSPLNMQLFIEKKLSSNLSNADIKTVLNWLNSKQGKNITRLEKEVASPEAYEEVEKFGSNYKNFQMDPKRQKLYDRLDKATKATDSAVDMAINTRVAITAAMTSFLPPEKRPSVGHLKGLIEQQRFQIEGRVTNDVLASLYFTYKELTDAELGEYVVFSESPVGEKYNRIILDAFNNAFLESSQKAGSAMGKMFEKKAAELKNKKP